VEETLGVAFPQVIGGTVTQTDLARMLRWLPRELPPAVAHFVGRDRELAELDESLVGPRPSAPRPGVGDLRTDGHLVRPDARGQGDADAVSVTGTDP
jgi:hypothetical protein